MCARRIAEIDSATRDGWANLVGNILASGVAESDLPFLRSRYAEDLAVSAGISREGWRDRVRRYLPGRPKRRRYGTRWMVG